MAEERQGSEAAEGRQRLAREGEPEGETRGCRGEAGGARGRGGAFATVRRPTSATYGPRFARIARPRGGQRSKSQSNETPALEGERRRSQRSQGTGTGRNDGTKHVEGKRKDVSADSTTNPSTTRYRRERLRRVLSKAEQEGKRCSWLRYGTYISSEWRRRSNRRQRSRGRDGGSENTNLGPRSTQPRLRRAVGL